MLSKFTCSCGKIRFVSSKVLWRVRFCEQCAYKHKQAEKKRRYHEHAQEPQWLLIHNPDGMDLWPKTPTFNRSELKHFRSGCKFRNLTTNETMEIN